MSQLEAFLEALRNLDIKVFTAESQTGSADRKSLLAVQNIVRNIKDHYVYLEVGSHLGGTLVPHLLDPQCRYVISVDSRPISQRDERGVMFDYKENSTERMLIALGSHVPASAFLKLMTLDADISDVTSVHVPITVDLALIDGEHTNVAVFRDFISVRQLMSDSCIVAFHDAHLLCDGLQNIECYLKHRGVVFESFFLPDCLFTIVMGDCIPLVSSMLQRMSFDRNTFIHNARILLLRQIANNVALIEDDQIGHR